MSVRVILVPYDSAYCRKRMGCGPDRVFASLKELLSGMKIPFDHEEISLESVYPTEISAAFQLSRKVAGRVRECRARGLFPIVLSGNCGVALGTVTGCGADKIGVVWFDAHGEATTPETTISGFLDGMPISTLLGRAWQTLARTVPGFAPVPGERIVLFGARQVEEAECKLLDEAGVQRVSTVEQLMRGLSSLAKLVDQIYLHVDLDVLDPTEATANQWTPPNGITLRTLLDGITVVRKHAKVVALGIASYDPAVDHEDRALSAATQVAEVLLTK
jgi:arginase